MLIMRYISIERNYSKSKSLDIQCRTKGMETLFQFNFILCKKSSNIDHFLLKISPSSCI